MFSSHLSRGRERLGRQHVSMRPRAIRIRIAHSRRLGRPQTWPCVPCQQVESLTKGAKRPSKLAKDLRDQHLHTDTPLQSPSDHSRDSGYTCLELVIVFVVTVVAGLALFALIPHLFQSTSGKLQPARKATLTTTTELNLRPCPRPDSTCPPIRSLPAGSELRLLRTQATWDQVQVVSGSQIGWVSARYVRSVVEAKRATTSLSSHSSFWSVRRLKDIRTRSHYHLALLSLSGNTLYGLGSLLGASMLFLVVFTIVTWIGTESGLDEGTIKIVSVCVALGGLVATGGFLGSVAIMTWGMGAAALGMMLGGTASGAALRRGEPAGIFLGFVALIASLAFLFNSSVADIQVVVAVAVAIDGIVTFREVLGEVAEDIPWPARSLVRPIVALAVIGSLIIVPLLVPSWPLIQFLGLSGFILIGFLAG